MPLELHNTLTNTTEPFCPADPAHVTFYTCGPTVYDYAHIGNFRAFLLADVLRRWIESPLCVVTKSDGGAHQGPRTVTHVMNITDVGHMTDDQAADGAGQDKMEAAAQRLLEDKKSGKLPPNVAFDPGDPYAIANFYADAFLEDARALGVKVCAEVQHDPSLMPRPTREIKAILQTVIKLLKQNNAYIAADNVVYFNTQSFPDYGELSGNTLDAIRSGAGGRVSQTAQAVKKHPADFMLWKPDPNHLMRWDPIKILSDPNCPLEEGYPGWHLECSVMAQNKLGSVIDLHSGGEDNIFPHHECEIAQSRCATGEDRFARCWFHVRHLFVEGEKMSKSKGNFYTIRQLNEKGFDSAAIRLELIKTHYRLNANFTEQGLKDSARMIERWRRFLRSAESSPEKGARNEDVASAFASSLHDDLNLAGAIGVINAWINRADSPTRADAILLKDFDQTLSVLALAPRLAPATDDPQADYINQLVAARQEARASKNWDEADRIRKELTELNVEVTDTPDGPTWTRKAKL